MKAHHLAAVLLAVFTSFFVGNFVGVKMAVTPFAQTVFDEIDPPWKAAPFGYFWETLSSTDQEICLCGAYAPDCSTNEGTIEVQYKVGNQITHTGWIKGNFLDKNLEFVDSCVAKQKGERVTFKIIADRTNVAALRLE